MIKSSSNVHSYKFIYRNSVIEKHFLYVFILNLWTFLRRKNIGASPLFHSRDNVKSIGSILQKRKFETFLSVRNTMHKMQNEKRWEFFLPSSTFFFHSLSPIFFHTFKHFLTRHLLLLSVQMFSLSTLLLFHIKFIPFSLYKTVLWQYYFSDSTRLSLIHYFPFTIINIHTTFIHIYIYLCNEAEKNYYFCCYLF